MTAKEAMAKLGTCTTAEDVAVLLIAERCSGTSGDSRTCPVAAFLAKCEDLAKPPLVGKETMRVVAPGFDEFVRATPVPVSEFVVRFDKGEWPELDADA